MSAEASMIKVSRTSPWMVNVKFEDPGCVRALSSGDGGLILPTVVRARLQPASMLPTSPTASSSTNNDQVPFGLPPLKMERVAAYGGAGAGAGNGSLGS